MSVGYKIGNGLGGVVPRFNGIQKLHFELTGVAPGSEAYKNLCDWFIREEQPSEPVVKADYATIQVWMVEWAFAEMYDRDELVQHLREVLTGDQAVMAELVIRRYGLDTPELESRKMTELAPEFAKEFGYAESTVRNAMIGKALDILRKDDYFREVLRVPGFRDQLFNYWRFVYLLLSDDDEWPIYQGWDEETALMLADRLTELGVHDHAVMEQAVENWLTMLPEEARLATRMKYGLGYPLIDRTDSYIASASGFDDGRNLLDFLRVKLNRASLAAILGVETAEVDYDCDEPCYPAIERGAYAHITNLGLPLKVAMTLSYDGIVTAGDLLGVDMTAEEDPAWTKHVPSKYWREVVQLWTDLRIKNEIGEYYFDDGYAFEKVS